MQTSQIQPNPPNAAPSQNLKSEIQNRLHLSPQRLQKIFAALDALFPKPECALLHENPFQLLVATILSAQCTDERVNKVTPELFRKCPTPAGLRRLAARRIGARDSLHRLLPQQGEEHHRRRHQNREEFGGQVPRTMDELLTLPGVARKTANVVLGTAFGIAVGVVVDTHVFRITHRLKLTKAKTPEKVEQDLMKLVPQDRWVSFSHQIIWFGRKICFARKPLCAECPSEPSATPPIKPCIVQSKQRHVRRLHSGVVHLVDCLQQPHSRIPMCGLSRIRS